VAVTSSSAALPQDPSQLEREDRGGCRDDDSSLSRHRPGDEVIGGTIVWYVSDFNPRP